MNGDGQVLTLSFSRRLIIAVAPRGAVPLERDGFGPRFVLDCYPYPRQRAVPFCRSVPAVMRSCLPHCHRVLTLRGCRSFPAVSVSLQVSRLSGPPFPAVGNGFIRSAITAARLSVLPEVCSCRPACIRRRLTSASCDTPVSRGVSGGCQSPIIRQGKKEKEETWSSAAPGNAPLPERPI